MNNNFKYKLLNRILIIQIGVAVFGALCVYISFYLTSVEMHEKDFQNKKMTIENEIQKHQQQWRAWAELDLKDPLQEEFNRFIKQNDLKNLRILHVNDISKFKDDRFSVIPKNIDRESADSNFYILAEFRKKNFIDIFQSRSDIFLVLIVLSSVFCLTAYASVSYLKHKIHSPLINLINYMQNNTHEEEEEEEEENLEFSSSDEMQLFITEIKMLYSKLRDTERKAAIGVIASQVSHDLMSPLYSLDVLLNISKMSGEEHELLKESISRIRGIAGSLLKKNSADGNTLEKKINLIESIQKTIKLKKLEYLQSSPEINFNFSTIQEVIYSNITHDNISRIISNLVNNSIESYEEKPAVVNIDLEVKGDIATISITDFGKGISEDLLAQIGDFGITFGKKKGSGIGLNHAMMVIKKENGNFKILSKQGLGTRIEMTIQIFSQENKV